MVVGGGEEGGGGEGYTWSRSYRHRPSSNVYSQHSPFSAGGKGG